MYGQTECSAISTQHHLDDAFEDVCHTVGQPLPQTAVSIRSLEDNSVVPVGVQGEICTRSYGTMLGYNDNEAATAFAIDSEGWLHSGDLGTMDARGYVRAIARGELRESARSVPLIELVSGPLLLTHLVTDLHLSLEEIE